MAQTTKILSRKNPTPTVDIEPPALHTTLTSPTSSEGSDVEDNQQPRDDQEPRTLLDIDDDPFSTETSKILFDAIDELRKIEAGQDLDLPQLVIVGKQSAGKSSLLQSLTDIPFPIGDGLCTQFATRIISRRTEPRDPHIIKASIESGDINPFPYPEDRTRAAAFERNFTSLNVEDFRALINDAKDIMGLSADRGSDSKTFSSLVLKIELSGPDRSHFGILDIPGIYSNRRAKTSQAQKEMDGVKEMVISYMKKRENIIICVADALDDVHNQTIFDLAERHVESSRVVGVWTKCDITPHIGTIVRHVKDGTGIPGRSTPWYVVQNRDSKNPNSFDREQAEKATFSTGAWLDIPERQRGTPMLKKFLARLLSKRIRDSFPVMQDTVARLLQQEIIRQHTFGNPRKDLSERRSFLVGIANHFQSLAIKSLRFPGDLPSNDLKLRGMTTALNDQFAADLSQKGLFYKFVEIGDPIETECGPEDIPTQNELFIQADFAGTESTRRGNPPTPSPSPARNTPKPGLPRTKVAELYQEIRSQRKTNRAEELPGMLNPAVLGPLWKKQTSKWQNFGEEHLERIVSTTESVSLKMFDLASSNIGMTDRARNKLIAVILKFAKAERAKAMQQLHELCTRNATMALQTTDHRFTVKVRECRSKRFMSALGRFAIDHPPINYISQLPTGKDSKPLTQNEEAQKIYYNWMIVSLNDVTALFNQIHPQGDRAQNVEDEIHDLLRSYYEISIENFTSYILHHIVEPFLTSSTGPLLGLSAEWVLNLTEEEVEDLGGEDESIVASREACISKIVRLEEANKIAEEALRRTREVAVC